jgi:hypothetical protein
LRDDTALWVSDAFVRREIATALSIKWPIPFSAALSERDKIDALILQFVDVAETRH